MDQVMIEPVLHDPVLPDPVLPDPECPDCTGSLDHCHGTLVVHTDYTVECTEAGCVLTHRERHALVVDCTAVAGGCSCEDVVAVRRVS
ncbi:hypothetical protein ACTHQY_12960 [Rhodococcoides corynebacterioides]|uniref:hypothetical protein n=1 Tax=Rhodococcoides corynebacterioides TaxID=53972 RepID=UPI003F807B88